MISVAAVQLGYKTHIYCPDEFSPAFQVTNKYTIGEYTDKKNLALFAGQVDVITYEFENIPNETVDYLSQFVVVLPKPEILSTCQNRIAEKDFINKIGIPTAKYESIESLEQLGSALQRIGYPAVLKSNTMGYDGKGQIMIHEGDDLQIIWKKMSEEIQATTAILESFVQFTCEVSVIVCRGLSGSVATFPMVENRHENHILRSTILPAPVSDEIRTKGEQYAKKLADAFDLVGVLAVEMFVTKDCSLLVNELAPRPHNSGHWTIEGAETSQFEQLVRSICGLPLGSTSSRVQKVEMRNLLGSEVNEWEGYLGKENTHVHLYGKKDIKPERKMGHVTKLSD